MRMRKGGQNQDFKKVDPNQNGENGYEKVRSLSEETGRIGAIQEGPLRIDIHFKSLTPSQIVFHLFDLFLQFTNYCTSSSTKLFQIRLYLQNCLYFHQ